MTAITKQTGASMLLWMAFIGAAGLTVVIGMRLGPIYIESYMVDGILEEVALESRDKKRNKNQIWNAISKRFTINNVNTVKREHFFYKKERGETKISFKYEVRTKLVGNLDGIMDFEMAKSFVSDG
ncbi:MAG: DUF4845 domain-containing protein [Gammaproteobacteria bacterium]|nr:DUF4845 domain-containing protein [Gammaproteobacteria bacterium]